MAKSTKDLKPEEMKPFVNDYKMLLVEARQNNLIYTGDVVKQLEKLVEQAKEVMQEIAIIDYSKVA